MEGGMKNWIKLTSNPVIFGEVVSSKFSMPLLLLFDIVYIHTPSNVVLG